jgi:mRNA interferase MazF
MSLPSVGHAIIIPFSYFDLSQSKRIHALVLAAVGRADFLLCQITSKQYDDSQALSLKEGDFHSGGIRVDNFIRVSKFFAANEALILGVAGHLTDSKLTEVIHYLIEMLSTCLGDDTVQHPDTEDGSIG